MLRRVLTKSEASLLLFLETQLVDYRGDVASAHMNAEDFVIAKRWSAEGFVSFRRKKMAEIRIRKTRDLQRRTHTVRFSPEAWECAHRLRRERAERYAETLSEGHSCGKSA